LYKQRRCAIGYQNREVEIKLIIDSSMSYNDLKKDLKKFMDNTYPSNYSVVSGNASDYYWPPIGGSSADFIRLRKRDSGVGGIITVKATDRVYNTNRIEIDLDIGDFKQGLALLTIANGPHLEKVTKKYHVFFTEDEHTNYSIYQVKGDDRVFMEVEGRSGKEVEQLVLDFMNWSEYRYGCRYVGSSIFDMFVIKKEPYIRDLAIGLSLIRVG